MKNQWCDLVYPGRKVKVRVKDELVDGEVETCHYIAKLSFDCLYFYATAKVDVRILYLGITKTFNLETCFCRLFCSLSSSLSYLVLHLCIGVCYI